MRQPKIVMIGGGSYGWAPNIVKDMMLTEGLGEAQFVLYDSNRSAAELVARVLGRVQEAVGNRATIVATDRQAEAFRGADYFIITISTGGLAAMAHDLAIPEKYGVYHTVGDTAGPGGWARLMRNFAVFRGLGEAINRYAPGAVVLNYSNPMATLTKILSHVCTGPVVGLCHGLFQNIEFLVEQYKLAGEDRVSVQYGGLNHFFWITAAKTEGRDLLADLRRRVRTRGLGELGRPVAADAAEIALQLIDQHADLGRIAADTHRRDE